MKKEKKGFVLLLKWAGKDAVYTYLAIVASLVASLCAIVPYYVFYKLTEHIVNSSLTEDIALHYAIFLIAFILIKVLASYSSILLSHRGAYNTLFKVRCMVTEHMAKMPLGSLNERSTGEIKTVMNESIEKLELFLAHNMPELVLYMAGPITIFVFLMSIHWILGLISIIPLIFIALTIVVMYKRFSKFMPEINPSNGELSSSISEYVNGMRLIKAYKMGALSFKKYASAIQNQQSLWARISRATAPLYAAYVVLLEAGAIIIIPVSGYMFIQGKITASVLILFAFIGSRFLTDIKPLQELANNLSFSMNGVKQVKEILDTPFFEGGKDFPKKHNIEVKNVSFQYDRSRIILQKCNLSIADGEQIAIVGESGAGKSTIVQLISRFYDTIDGEITIGGMNVKNINYEQLLQNISVVFQQSFLTRGSIYENITMGKTDATMNMVKSAAKEAQIDDFIESLPNGYSTLVGDYGGRFSGGQKQRICIARAILKNSPILILDEATSAADPENQVEIDKAIENLCKGKTVIIVAHRLGVVQNCNRIAVVEKGTISHFTSFDQLLKESKYFAKAWSDYNAARSIQYSLEGSKA